MSGRSCWYWAWRGEPCPAESHPTPSAGSVACLRTLRVGRLTVTGSWQPAAAVRALPGVRFRRWGLPISAVGSSTSSADGGRNSHEQAQPVRTTRADTIAATAACCGRSVAELQGCSWRLRWQSQPNGPRLARRKKWWLLSHRSSARCSRLITELKRSTDGGLREAGGSGSAEGGRMGFLVQGRRGEPYSPTEGSRLTPCSSLRVEGPQPSIMSVLRGEDSENDTFEPVFRKKSAFLARRPPGQ